MIKKFIFTNESYLQNHLPVKERFGKSWRNEGNSAVWSCSRKGVAPHPSSLPATWLGAQSSPASGAQGALSQMEVPTPHSQRSESLGFSRNVWIWTTYILPDLKEWRSTGKVFILYYTKERGWKHLFIDMNSVDKVIATEPSSYPEKGAGSLRLSQGTPAM